MENYTYNSIVKKIEYYLYSYDLIDYKIDLLRNKADNYNYKQTYNVWIKNQNSLEDEAIRNIDNERKILKLYKLKNLISEVLEEYKITDKTKYLFICLRYFRRLKPIKIKDKINLDYREQINSKNEVIRHILVVAIKKKILKEVEV